MSKIDLHTHELIHFSVDLDTKGFKIHAKDAHTFSLDPTGAKVLTNFFIDLLDLNDSKITELFKKYRITVYNKVK